VEDGFFFLLGGGGGDDEIPAEEGLMKRLGGIGNCGEVKLGGAVGGRQWGPCFRKEEPIAIRRGRQKVGGAADGVPVEYKKNSGGVVLSSGEGVV